MIDTGHGEEELAHSEREHPLTIDEIAEKEWYALQVDEINDGQIEQEHARDRGHEEAQMGRVSCVAHDNKHDEQTTNRADHPYDHVQDELEETKWS